MAENPSMTENPSCQPLPRPKTPPSYATTERHITSKKLNFFKGEYSRQFLENGHSTHDDTLDPLQNKGTGQRPIAHMRQFKLMCEQHTAKTHCQSKNLLHTSFLAYCMHAHSKASRECCR